MALSKKLMCFKTQANFDAQLAAGEINDYSIVFIQDTQKIWTHQTYFGSTGDLSDYYTKDETYSKEEVDALIDEIESTINDLSDKVTELENSQISVEAGENIAVTKDGNVYTVSAEFDTSNLATKDELSDVSDKVESNSSSIENLQEQITEIESGGVDLTNYYTKGETNDLLNEKQDILSAGDNISITDNVISVDLDDYATTSSLESGLAAKQDTITAGTGLEFSGNTLNCTIDDTLFVVVTSLPSAPAADDEHKIHLVPLSTTGTDNKYAEYLWVDGAWEKLGELTTSTDLSGYYTSEQIDSLLSDKQDKLTAGTNVSISSSNVISATDTDTGATSVSVSGTSPLTLTGSYSSSSRKITISGSVDTYSKSEIDDKLSTATSGGLTDVTASGTSPLTLSASKSGSTVDISGSVDLSDYATTSSVNSSISTLTTSIDSKQDKLTAGDNITISDNTISATDTTYSGGSNVNISSSNVISVDLSNYVTSSSLSTSLGNYLPLSGGTLTGPLTANAECAFNDNVTFCDYWVQFKGDYVVTFNSGSSASEVQVNIPILYNDAYDTAVTDPSSYDVVVAQASDGKLEKSSFSTVKTAIVGDLESKIDSEISDREAVIVSSEDDTYVLKQVDASDNLLIGFKTNGEMDVPVGLSDDAYALIYALYEKLEKLSATVESLC